MQVYGKRECLMLVTPAEVRHSADCQNQTFVWIYCVSEICHPGGFALVVADDEEPSLDSLYGILVHSKEASVMTRLIGRGPGEEESQDVVVWCGSSNHRFFFLPAAPSSQPDLFVLLHATHQPFGKWAELWYLYPSAHANTHEQSAHGYLGDHFNRWALCSCAEGSTGPLWAADDLYCPVADLKRNFWPCIKGCVEHYTALAFRENWLKREIQLS